MKPETRKRTYQIVAGVVTVLTATGLIREGLDAEQIVNTIEGVVVIFTALMANRHVNT